MSLWRRDCLGIWVYSSRVWLRVAWWGERKELKYHSFICSVIFCQQLLKKRSLINICVLPRWQCPSFPPPASSQIGSPLCSCIWEKMRQDWIFLYVLIWWFSFRESFPKNIWYHHNCATNTKNARIRRCFSVTHLPAWSSGGVVCATSKYRFSFLGTMFCSRRRPTCSGKDLGVLAAVGRGHVLQKVRLCFIPSPHC